MPLATALATKRSVLLRGNGPLLLVCPSHCESPPPPVVSKSEELRPGRACRRLTDYDREQDNVANREAHKIAPPVSQRGIVPWPATLAGMTEHVSGGDDHHVHALASSEGLASESNLPPVMTGSMVVVVSR